MIKTEMNCFTKPITIKTHNETIDKTLKYKSNYSEVDSLSLISVNKKKQESIQISLPVVTIEVSQSGKSYDVNTGSMSVYLSHESKRAVTFSSIPMVLDKRFIDNIIDVNDTDYDRDHRGKSYLEVLMMILEIDHSNRLEIINTYKANSKEKNYIIDLNNGVNQALFIFAECLSPLKWNSNETMFWSYIAFHEVGGGGGRFATFYEKFKKHKNRSLGAKSGHDKKRKREEDEKKIKSEKENKKQRLQDKKNL
jgi:hypothetical protein